MLGVSSVCGSRTGGFAEHVRVRGWLGGWQGGKVRERSRFQVQSMDAAREAVKERTPGGSWLGSEGAEGEHGECSWRERRVGGGQRASIRRFAAQRDVGWVGEGAALRWLSSSTGFGSWAQDSAAGAGGATGGGRVRRRTEDCFQTRDASWA
jgi:hypothetical protein